LYPNLLVDWPTPGWSASSTMTVLECLSSNQRFKPRPCDPRKLRNDFLGLKEDTESLLAFLNHYGAWQVGFYDGAWDVIQNTSKTVSPYYFWHYRAQLRRRLEEASLKPATWFTSSMGPAALHRIPEYPLHSYLVSYALDAIEASFTLAFLEGFRCHSARERIVESHTS
jgi:hypothetical protein